MFQEFTSHEEDETSWLSDEEEEDVESTQQETEITCVPTAEFPKYDDGIWCLAGLVAYKLKEKYPEIVGDAVINQVVNLPSWLESHSKRDRTNPSQELVQQVKEMDKIFISQHGSHLVDKAPAVMARFCDKVAQQHPGISR